jgi:hypothetical protein
LTATCTVHRSKKAELTRLQYDYDLMHALTGNTPGSLKKMWPTVKKKAAEAHASFAAFIGVPNCADAKKPAAPAKVAGARKRKGAGETDGEADSDPKSASAEVKPKAAGGRKRKTPAASDAEAEDAEEVDTKKTPAAKAKRAPAAKKSKKEVKSEEDSADGGDGLGQYTREEKAAKWLSETDDGF